MAAGLAAALPSDSEEDEEWGSIRKVVNEPPEDVQGDETWCSCIGMWLTCPICCLVGLTGGCAPCYVSYGIGSCSECSTNWCSVEGTVRRGRPCLMSWIWWRYVIAGVCAFAINMGSRLSLFIWEWGAYGYNRFWYHGVGIWSHSYEDVGKVLMSYQDRKATFGCMNAPVPDLFASDILIFLSNDGNPNSQWAVIRQALHTLFLSGSDYNSRIAQLPSMIEKDWLNPSLADLNDVALLQRMVAKSVFYVMFGIWIDDDEATVLAGWRTSAGLFIFPRLVQRFICNIGINKVKKLRVNTVDIIQDNGLEHVFEKMNEMLGPWQREQTVKLCDEIMYVIGFAGIGGTCACVESCGAFLQAKKPSESPADKIDFGEYDSPEKMVAAYKANQVAYIKEVCRQDPPVTSASHVVKEEVEATLAGRPFTFPKGTVAQYVVSMANRDEAKFPEPEMFDPTRGNLNETFTWNGAFGDPGMDGLYPRICPGRYLALDITKAILDHATAAEYRLVN